MSLTPEQIEQNWLRFKSLCEKTGDRAPALNAMLEELGMRLCLCPASAKRDYHGAFAGGLADHSLRVLNNLVTLNNAYGWKLNKASMIIVALFHDIGKIGMPGADASNDFYLPQTDAWKAEKKGEEFVYNNNLTYMSTPDRSVFLMQHYGVRLTADEWIAIRANDGWVVEQNKSYCLKVSPLVFGLQTADYLSTMQEKSNVPGWVPEEETV